MILTIKVGRFLSSDNRLFSLLQVYCSLFEVGYEAIYIMWMIGRLRMVTNALVCLLNHMNNTNQEISHHFLIIFCDGREAVYAFCI
jgi:hypothetical protein